MGALRVCLAAAEVVPFAKTGGLADVAAALPAELSALGHDARIFLPLYRRVRKRNDPLQPVPGAQDFAVRCGSRSVLVSIHEGRLPGGTAPKAAVPGAAAVQETKTGQGARASGPRVYFVECDELYDRDALYTQDPDEHVRWAVFTRAILETCQRLQWSPDIIHCNDWHTGLLPVVLKTEYAWDQLFAVTKTLLTIHNIGYQGAFPSNVLDEIGLSEQRRFLHQEDLENGQVNFLKTGILWADALSTVSSTYAREIQTAEFGNGLEGALSDRASDLHGILNGVDYSSWDPATDPNLWANYSADDPKGKEINRSELLALFELRPDPRGPVFGIVSRLTGQKGFEILPDALPIFLHREDIRLVVLGSGEEGHERYFQWLRDAFPGKVGFFRGYDEPLAHRIEAGADVFLMPSRYEPCGLNQMYSLRYGTVPLVRSTGGLADTVERWDPERREGTGFVFFEFSSPALCGVMEHSIEVYRDRAAWSLLQAAGMRRDFSWQRQAPSYIDLYRSLLPLESPSELPEVGQ